MPILPRLRGVLRSLAGRGPVQRDLDADISACLEILVDEKMAAGMSADEARRRAQLELGGVEQVKEAVRATRPGVLLDTLARDARYSLRLLAKTPGFSLTAILVLALGIGVNAGVFSIVNLLCFKPLPGAGEPGEPVAAYVHDPAKPDSYRSFPYADYETVRDQAPAFNHVMAHTTYQVGVTEGASSRRTRAELVTGSYFATLGVRLAAGRTFSREEERPESRAAVMVVSHSYWKRLGSPADILGRTIVVNSQRFTVIGLAPAGFAGRIVLAGPEFWMPLGAAALFSAVEGRPPASSGLHLMVVGRLKPGVTMTAANGGLNALSASLARRADGAQSVVTVHSLSRYNQGSRPNDDDEDGLGAALGALEGAALIVLIIASLNVANMQLARGTSRRKEIAMRLALGAGRARIVGQLLMEGVILAAAGGVLGVMASVWTLDAVAASLAAVVPDTITADTWPDWRVVLACLTFCALSAVAFGLGPAWKLSRLDLLPEMKSQEGTGAGPGLRRFGPRNLLVAGQVALSLALLGASGLFVRSALATGTADPGYRFDGQWLARIDAATGGLDERAGRDAYRRLLERIRSTPGVESASPATFVAFGNNSFSRRVWRAETARGATEAGVTTVSYEVGAAYFRTLGLSMLRGREFSPAEEVDATATAVAIIDEPLAAVLFPGEDAIGQFLEFGSDVPRQGNRVVRIVGLAPGLRHRLRDPVPVPHIYLPLGSHYRPALNVHVRAAAGGPSGAEGVRVALRDTVRGADTRLALLGVQTLEEARDAVPLNWIVRAAARTFGGFGLVALFMASIGLYGVKAYLVARRTREFGIRLALGASAGSLIGMVLAEGAALLGVGLIVGFLLAVGLGQAVSGLLVGVQPLDPLVLSVATLVLSAAVLAACYLPARQATRVSPITALRVE